jgi:hypothetical protein
MIDIAELRALLAPTDGSIEQVHPALLETRRALLLSVIEIERLRAVVQHDSDQIIEWKRSHSELCTEVFQMRHQIDANGAERALHLAEIARLDGELGKARGSEAANLAVWRQAHQQVDDGSIEQIHPVLLEARRALLLSVIEIEQLRTRQAELLATIVRVTNENPDEIKGWEAQRAAMIAEIGTLKAALAATSLTDLELRTRLLEACDLFAHKADYSAHGNSGGVAKSQRMRINELRKLAES